MQQSRLCSPAQMFWAQLRLILARAARQGLISSERGQKILFMPKNINDVSHYYHFGWLHNFDWLLTLYDCLIPTIHCRDVSRFSNNGVLLVYFSGLTPPKFSILACKMQHNAQGIII